jgi:hypothetical protein
MRYMKLTVALDSHIRTYMGFSGGDWGFWRVVYPSHTRAVHAVHAATTGMHAHALQCRIVRATYAHLEHETRAQEIITAPNHSPADATWPT